MKTYKNRMLAADRDDEPADKVKPLKLSAKKKSRRDEKKSESMGQKHYETR